MNSLDIRIYCNQIKEMTAHLLTVLLLLHTIQGGIQYFESQDFTTEQVLVSDISHKILMNQTSTSLNVSYLSIFEGQLSNQYHGKTLGWAQRALVAIPVKLRYKSCPTIINIIFKVDTGAPFSYLTQEAINELYKYCPQNRQDNAIQYPITISGYSIDVKQSKAHFLTLNILGADFLRKWNCRLEFDYLQRQEGQFKLLIKGSRLIKKKEQKEKGRVKVEVQDEL